MQKVRRVLFGCLFLAAAVGWATEVSATSIVLDNPNQSVAAPATGTTTVIFSGTATIDQFFDGIGATVDQPFNSSQTNALVATLDSGFFAFASGGTGTYTGLIFSLEVSSLNPPDLYGTKIIGGPSVVTLFYASPIQVFNVTAAFSLNVTAPNGGNGGNGGNQVPENGQALLFLGSSLVAILFARHAFLVHAKQRA